MTAITRNVYDQGRQQYQRAPSAPRTRRRRATGDGTGADDADVTPDRASGRKSRLADDPAEAAGSPVPATGQRTRVAAGPGALDEGVRGGGVCHACELVRMTSYRTGQVVSYQRADGSIRREPRPQRQEDEPPTGDQADPGANELPSVALTTKFLELCQQCGSEQLAVRIVAAGRSTDAAPGCPGCRRATTGWRGTPTRCGQRSSTCSSSWAGDAGSAVASKIGFHPLGWPRPWGMWTTRQAPSGRRTTILNATVPSL